MYKCEYCEKEFKTLKGLSSHISQVHKFISIKDYYIKYFSNGEHLCKECNEPLKDFVSLSCGFYSKLCVKCASLKSRQKSSKTCIKKYGVIHPMQNEKIKQKVIKTNLRKFGKDHWLKITENKNVLKQNLLNKYSVDNVSKIESVKKKKKETYLNNFMQKVLSIYLEKINICIISDYVDLQTNVTFKCKNCGYVFNDTMFNVHQRLYPCPKCRNYNRSTLEQEIVNFLEQLNIDFKVNVRNIIPPKELDIYIPDKKIAIEFDGLYWHSEEMGCDRNYHLNKTNDCQKQNIQLIHIFEDEWLYKQDIVKARLKQILGASNIKRIHARKCIIKEIEAKTKNEFLEKYHIQGKDSSKIKLGAFHNDELVSVMTFSHGNISKGSKRIDGVWELNRFCSNYNYHIPGIASKLLKFFERYYQWNQIFSYADRRWSIGNVYEKLGFELEYITYPNYWYLDKNLSIRIHRFKLRKTEKDPKNKTEKKIRLEEGYMRIWDCGNLKFLKVNK